MRGLRTEESEKFKKFFSLVEKKAALKNCVFFLNFGECEDIEFEDMIIDTLFGWLVPMDKVDIFEKDFLQNRNLDKFDNWLIWCTHKISNNKLNISFENF